MRFELAHHSGGVAAESLAASPHGRHCEGRAELTHRTGQVGFV